jgi:cardiolipin synthase A/B
MGLGPAPGAARKSFRGSGGTGRAIGKYHWLDCHGRGFALGVSVFRYQKTMLHTKLILVDDLVCCIGSPNMNHRSMGKDEECCVVALDPELAATLAAEFENDCTDAEKLEYSAWSKRGGLLKLREQLARTLIEQL